MKKIVLNQVDNKIKLTTTENSIKLARVENTVKLDILRHGKDGVGIAVGGSTGQALIKKSTLDYDTLWSDCLLTINHGLTANTLRPITDGYIIWYGMVEPINAIDGDLWVEA